MPNLSHRQIAAAAFTQRFGFLSSVVRSFPQFQWKFDCEMCGSFLWYVTFIWQRVAYFVSGSTPSLAWLLHIQRSFWALFISFFLFLIFFSAHAATELGFYHTLFFFVILCWFILVVHCAATSFFFVYVYGNLLSFSSSSTLHFTALNSKNEYSLLKANLTAITLNELNRMEQKNVSNQMNRNTTNMVRVNDAKTLWNLFFTLQQQQH